MATPHNEANLGDFAKTVIMPGDPKRAELIANKYLENAVLVNDVRGMKAYTGTYKGKKISVMAHGMGMPSMGIYSYELYKFYDVDTIIRIGSCGSYVEDLHLLDLILVDETYAEGNYALTFNNENVHIIKSNADVNEIIENTAKELNIKYKKGTTFCSECFYMPDIEKFWERVPKDLKLLGVEMESFALFYNAKVLNKKASCLLTVTDDLVRNEASTSEERQKSLNTMIELALESAVR